MLPLATRLALLPGPIMLLIRVATAENCTGEGRAQPQETQSVFLCEAYNLGLAPAPSAIQPRFGLHGGGGWGGKPMSVVVHRRNLRCRQLLFGSPCRARRQIITQLGPTPLRGV